jgi:capsular exopolysaccharide synthesis family protein
MYMVTSATRREGKSTICSLLAIVSAMVYHKRTLVIDGDFRRPSLHKLLGLGEGLGLCEALGGRISYDFVIRRTALPLLFAISSGKPFGPAGEAYRDEEFARLIASVRQGFELIFVDSPPVLPVIEPLLMAEHVDGLLLVVMAARTPLALVRRMRQILKPVTPKVCGSILNNAMDGLPYYYDHRYYGRRPQVRRNPVGSAVSSARS